jgi:hypothetical protein
MVVQKTQGGQSLAAADGGGKANRTDGQDFTDR